MKQLKEFLIAHRDNFAWCTSDMPRIDSSVIEHNLNIDPTITVVQQRLRRFKDEKEVTVKEVKKLLQARFIREIAYPTWLANVVMVKKANEKWRIYVDFTDLNRACPKDCYPLSKISTLVDATSGYKTLSFLDAFSSYHQIRMCEADKKHTSFQAAGKRLCYNVMPFGLKNAGATYQRMMDKVFKEQIGKNVEVYVDDLVIKTPTNGSI